MICLRIFVTYSYRLTRRHSTAFLIASLIFGLTIILQLYALRHQDHSSTHHIIGDFDYKPGAFLKDLQPNENISYCQFNYGLPYAFNWGSLQVHPSPEGGIKGPFKVIYNAIRGTAYENVSKYDTVTYVTQATPEFIYHIVEIARYWDGPISLSVFVPDYDLDITMQIMDHLCHCYSSMAKVSLHLFYHKKFPPRLGRDPVYIPVFSTPSPNETVEEAMKRKMENYKKLTNETRAEYIQKSINNKMKRMMGSKVKRRTSAPYLSFKDCSGLDTFDLATFRRLINFIYPINVGRNSARNASRTNYFLVSDIEMVPSSGLAVKFTKMLRKLIGARKRDKGCIIPNTVFVVPVFEVQKGEHIPHDKETLVNMIAENRAMYFHQKICMHCQRFPGMQTWLRRPSPAGVQPMLIARREYPYHRWEPLYFGTNREPWYSESLTWEGLQDKMTQMLELCLQGYRMVILDGGFLCHAARTNTNRLFYHRARRSNAKHYADIIESFKLMYPDRGQCKINFGFKS
ncbi:uncharacterized protein LOC126375396 [Pectinophora gossypiella]|uniref:uncharacterized protein LOC126375396 n=1 Tax=Pectinophora gossypiella TaxID=13191 RepID=UPI00214EE110|nr:uncharacterized protein LOC126375396 [Pectinophora gossypiella]